MPFSPLVQSRVVGDRARAPSAGFIPSSKDSVRTRNKLFLPCSIQKLPPDGSRAVYSKLRSFFLRGNSSHFRRKVTHWGILKLPFLLNINLTNLAYSPHQLQTDFLQLYISPLPCAITTLSPGSLTQNGILPFIWHPDISDSSVSHLWGFYISLYACELYGATICMGWNKHSINVAVLFPLLSRTEYSFFWPLCTNQEPRTQPG